MPTIIDCDESYAPTILSILNAAIRDSTAVYDYQPRTAAMMAEWFAVKRRHDYPVIGVVDEQSELMGFASYGTFRSWAGYKYTVEHSLYIDQPYRGRGLGKLLLGALIERAQQDDYHVMIGGIDSQNQTSIALHEQLGFKLAGTLPQVGFKFGRWQDLCFYQLILDTPQHPVEAQ
jgi:L-amino acid N-acyltransferase